MRRISTPASTAITAISAGEAYLVMPPIIKASVTIMPSKPNFWRNLPVRIKGERVTGYLSSQAEINKCAVITLSTPAAIACWKGGNSISAKRSSA